MNEQQKLVAESIWRSGYLKDKNKVRQQAKESMRQLIAIDIAASLAHVDNNFNQEEFMASCRLN